MADADKVTQERINQEADAAIVEEVEQRVTDRAELLKHCLQALTVAGVPLNLLTADVLHELGTYIHHVIHEFIDDDGEGS